MVADLASASVIEKRNCLAMRPPFLIWIELVRLHPFPALPPLEGICTS